MTVKQQASWHLLGAGGIGMSALADILLDRGNLVSGSDQGDNARVQHLRARGAAIAKGHSADHVPEGATVVYSSAVGDENPEYEKGRERGKLWHRSELLAYLMEDQDALLVAGTHGKTTTSALLAHVLRVGGKDPSFAVGGSVPSLGGNGAHGTGRYFVAEADESDGSFIRYHPHGAIVTNLDDDHLDHYGSSANLEGAFKQFLFQVQQPHLLFFCGDDRRLKQLCEKGTSYGLGAACTLRATGIRVEGWSTRFEVFWSGESQGELRVPLSGSHNVCNTLAVYGLARRLGLSHEQVQLGLNGFTGVGRRTECLGERQGVLFLDDYAHHPVEVKTTLDGVRKALGDRPLLAIFQPHRFSRTRDCMGQFGRCFEAADRVWVTDIYGAGEEPQSVHPQEIVDEVQAATGMVAEYVTFEALSSRLGQEVRPLDAVVTLGAGNVTEVGRRFMESLDDYPITKLKVALCYGGESGEHEIALASARFMAQALEGEHYQVEKFYVSPGGRWVFDEGAYLAGAPFEEKGPRFSNEVLQRLCDCELAVPVFHGPMGEDGTVQGFFEILGRPYTGGSFRNCSLSMDKEWTKRVCAAGGISTAPDVILERYSWDQDSDTLLDEIESKLSFPVFVKPPHLGSSLGVSRAEDRESCRSAIEATWRWGNRVMVEKEVVGRQIEFAVLGEEEVAVAKPGEILNHGAFYDFEAKYGESGMGTKVPAELSEELVEQGLALAKTVVRLLGGSSMARLDFFLTENGEYLLNEVNPIPGCTAISLYPQCWAAEGIAGADLVEKLIMAGKRRFSLAKRWVR